MVGLTAPTTISLSWTSAGSVVDSYEVMWQRDTSGDCPDEDEGSMSITDGSTSYMITELEEDSSYSITVKAMNSMGMATSNTATGVTQDARKQQTADCDICQYSSECMKHCHIHNIIFLQRPLLNPQLWERRVAHSPASLSSGGQ